MADSIKTIMIACDKKMIVHLLRNWRPNRLQPRWFLLKKERPRLISRQQGICALCSNPLGDDGKVTHIDHEKSVQTFSNEVLRGELTFDEAYGKLWNDSNLRAVHSGCNYRLNKKIKDQPAAPS